MNKIRINHNKTRYQTVTYLNCEHAEEWPEFEHLK